MFLNQDCSTAEDADWKLQDPHITATNNDRLIGIFFWYCRGISPTFGQFPYMSLKAVKFSDSRRNMAIGAYVML